MRAPHHKTTTGCLTCRERRKKCDERKPTCNACIRNKIKCSWALSVAKLADRDLEKPPPAARRHDQGFLTRHLSTYPRSPFLSDAVSRSSYEYYYLATSRMLGCKPAADNPYLTCVLPLARSDPLVMQTVITAGAGHLTVKSNTQDTVSSFGSQYLKLLRLLNLYLDLWTSGNESKTVPIIAATLLLSQIEIFAGNNEVAPFQHVKACRSLIIRELSKKHTASEDTVLAFLTELYAYMVLVQNISPTTEFSSRTLPFDPLVSDLERLRQFSTSGAMFGCAHGLFELIPAICAFGSERRIQMSMGQTNDESMQEFEDLRSKVVGWRPPELTGSPDWVRQQRSGAEVQRSGTLIFLYAALHQTTLPTAEFVADVQPVVARTLSMGLPLVSNPQGYPMVTIMLWPALLVGSCITNLAQQKIVDKALAIIYATYQADIVESVRRIMNVFWTQKDTYGPIALDQMIRNGGLKFCIA